MDNKDLKEMNENKDLKKELPKKASYSDFIAKKRKKEEDKNKTIDAYVTSMDRTITLKKPSESRIFSYINEIEDMQDFEKVINANRKMIYDCCEELHDIQLHEELGISDPYDVAKELFDIADVKEIMNQFNQLTGGSRNVDEETKNS
jgi:hypothetical protein